jgi:hypothetical protein
MYSVGEEHDRSHSQSHQRAPSRPRRGPGAARIRFPAASRQQKAALQAWYAEVGFARSLLAYEMPDGWLKLIDGHLRRDLDPDMEVDVEILDVTDEEARALLLSIDPLAALAETQEQIHQRLLEITPTDSEELKAAWRATAEKLVGGAARHASAYVRLLCAIPHPGHLPRSETAGGAFEPAGRRGASAEHCYRRIVGRKVATWADGRM